jgi:hypothetical protein
MQRKTWFSILGLDAMPLSLKNMLLRNPYFRSKHILCYVSTFLVGILS